MRRDYPLGNPRRSPILRGDRKVAACSNKWFNWSDTHGIDIADGEDDILILASSVVIDMVRHDDDGNH